MKNIRTQAGFAAGETIEGIKLFLEDKAVQIKKGTMNSDHSKLATLDQEGKIRVWDSNTKALLATVSGTYVDEGNIPLIRFSETGNSLTVTDNESVKTVYFSPDESARFVEVKKPRERES